MKKIFFILSLLFVTSIPLFAQDADDDNNEGGEKIRDKMNEFIQKRLKCSKDEADKFTPIFIRYFKEWRQTIRENKTDKLVLTQKIAELRLRYRPQFREIVGEQRGDQVFDHQQKFIQEIKQIRQERLGNNPQRPVNKPRVNRLLQN